MGVFCARANWGTRKKEKRRNFRALIVLVRLWRERVGFVYKDFQEARD